MRINEIAYVKSLCIMQITVKVIVLIDDYTHTSKKIIFPMELPIHR